MEQIDCSTKGGKYKHLGERDRYRLEGYLESGLSLKEISARLNSHPATIYREIKRGRVKRISSDLNEYWVYRANAAQGDYNRKVTKRRHALKIEKHPELAGYIRDKICKERYSPDAITGLLKLKEQKFNGWICTKTLYNYIERGVITGVSNLSLWEKRKRRKRKYRQIHRVGLKNKNARRIEERPLVAKSRLEYGHWEGDCLKSRLKKKVGLFTLTERRTREEIILKIESLTQEAILEAMNKLENRYQQYFKDKFKSITFDNGGEFLGWQNIENSILNNQKRTLVYFAHPYSAWERGTNENQNRMIRRFIPKGTDISKISDEDIETIEKWMNNYPRKILGYKTANEMVFEATNNNLGVFN